MIVKFKQKPLLQTALNFSDIEKKLINRLQYDLPLITEPFVVIAKELGLSETQVLGSLRSLQERGVITRFGPLFDISKRQGAVSLCALKVPAARLEEVSRLVNGYPQVAHNYQREHEWNMWFVLACKSKQELEDTFEKIVKLSLCPGINCPKEKEFFVGLNLAL